MKCTFKPTIFDSIDGGCLPTGSEMTLLPAVGSLSCPRNPLSSYQSSPKKRPNARGNNDRCLRCSAVVNRPTLSLVMEGGLGTGVRDGPLKQGRGCQT